MNTKISEMEKTTTLKNDDLIPIVQDDENRVITGNMLKRNILNVGTETAIEIATPETNKIYKINFTKIVNKIGEKLTLEDGSIKINDNVNKIMVSLNLVFCLASIATTPQPLVFRICKNDAIIIAFANTVEHMYSNAPFSFANFLMSVEKDDIISIQFPRGTGTNYDGLSLYNTSLTIEVLE